MADQIMNERIAGALACIELLKKLIHSAENPPEPAHGAREFFENQRRDAGAFVAALGPFTPAQEGAILCLAEYIHETATCGEPYMPHWMPFAAQAPEEFEALITKINDDEYATDSRS